MYSVNIPNQRYWYKGRKQKEYTLSILLRYSFKKAKKELDKCNLNSIKSDT